MISKLRTLLILGRVSNVPTVWSNCLAAWWLGGGGNFEKLPLLFIGATLVYIGGMFLNDACDVEFDRAIRSERPIPSGKISAQAVWRWSFVWIIGGSFLLATLGTTTAFLTVALTLLIVLYDLFHKFISFAPVLMGGCRLLLYLVAASCGAHGVTGWSIWSGFALMAYIVGLSFIARVESAPGPLRFGPLILLLGPIVLALVINAGETFQSALVLSAIAALWIFRNLRFVFISGQKNFGRAVGGLLAGITFIDMLAVPHFPIEWVWIFPALFLLALCLQRSVPAS